MKTTNELLNHLAFSIAHGTFDDSNPGGCSCEDCVYLVLKIDELRREEAAEF